MKQIASYKLKDKYCFFHIKIKIVFFNVGLKLTQNLCRDFFLVNPIFLITEYFSVILYFIKSLKLKKKIVLETCKLELIIDSPFIMSSHNPCHFMVSFNFKIISIKAQMKSKCVLFISYISQLHIPRKFSMDYWLYDSDNNIALSFIVLCLIFSLDKGCSATIYHVSMSKVLSDNYKTLVLTSFWTNLAHTSLQKCFWLKVCNDFEQSLLAEVTCTVASHSIIHIFYE